MGWMQQEGEAMTDRFAKPKQLINDALSSVDQDDGHDDAVAALGRSDAVAALRAVLEWFETASEGPVVSLPADDGSMPSKRREAFKERDSFVIEAAMQMGFIVDDDEVTAFRVTDEWLLEFHDCVVKHYEERYAERIAVLHHVNNALSRIVDDATAKTFEDVCAQVQAIRKALGIDSNGDEVLSFYATVGTDSIVHSHIKSGPRRSFPLVEKALRDVIASVQHQVDQRSRCPANPSKGNV